MSEENIFREELQRMMLKLKDENEALLRLIRALNRPAETHDQTSHINQTKKTIKP